MLVQYLLQVTGDLCTYRDVLSYRCGHDLQFWLNAFHILVHSIYFLKRSYNSCVCVRTAVCSLKTICSVVSYMKEKEMAWQKDGCAFLIPFLISATH